MTTRISEVTGRVAAGSGGTPAVRVAGLWGYGVLGAVGGGAAALLGRNPFVLERPWLGTSGVAAVLLSAGLGTILGAATVTATHAMVRRAAWARALHADLRPVVRGAGPAALAAVALASGLAEEVLFRGVLVPVVGALASSIAFGLVHQVRGRARWAWMAWAALMGLLFAGVFQATGSLVGAVVAHVWINAHNLRFLRDADLEDKPRKKLGGLLGR
jgi:membrane protease YdiL (CAAX protease family)